MRFEGAGSRGLGWRRRLARVEPTTSARPWGGRSAQLTTSARPAPGCCPLLRPKRPNHPQKRAKPAAHDGTRRIPPPRFSRTPNLWLPHARRASEVRNSQLRRAPPPDVARFCGLNARTTRRSGQNPDRNLSGAARAPRRDASPARSRRPRARARGARAPGGCCRPGGRARRRTPR